MNRDLVLQVIYNLIAAPILVMLVGLIKEPWRQRAMAALMGVAAVVYIGNGLGRYEYLFAAALAACAVCGIRWYRAIGVGWLIHTASDAIHHAIGAPMVASIPLSSFGCAVLDPLLSIYFFANAPSTAAMVSSLRRRRRGPA